MPGPTPDQLARQTELQRTNAQQLDQFNQSLRANPQYQALLRSLGVNPAGPVNLSPDQRKHVEAWVRANVGDIGKLEIDPAGNVNQNEGLLKQLGDYGPAAAGIGLSLFGLPGVFNGALNAGTAAPALGNVNGTIDALQGSAALGGVTGGSAAMSAGDKLKRALTSPEGIASLASLVPVLAMRGSSNNGGADAAGLQRINAITEARMRRADPLHQVAVQLAYGRAPVSARQGVSLQNVPLPQ